MTNPKRIATAVEKAACNCLLLKVNQIGSVTESIDAHLLAKKNGWGTMVSHRYAELGYRVLRKWCGKPREGDSGLSGCH